jgi:hypothetical protein
MKKLLIIILAVNSLASMAQKPSDSTQLNLRKAKVLSNAKSPSFNPIKAFSIYSHFAQLGNAEAMNGLGNLYNLGIGTAMDENTALVWFKRSADNGFPQAWYNLAMMYKNGIGVPIDYTKAFDYYSKGAALGNPLCIYGKGYMLYKGYGCAQNYDLAAELFKKGAAFGDEGSWYMLGLCYRNGYGVATNLDSAKFWLNKAASRGDQRAKNELADVSPENLDIRDIPNLQPGPSSKAQPVNLKTGYKKLTQHLLKNDITGDYSGYVIKFDWSGKHIIGQNALQLKLTETKKSLSGEWNENGNSIAISGIIRDTAIMFNNTSGVLADHYHKSSPLAMLFMDSKLNMFKSGDTVYLTGNLTLYSPKLKEPQRPEFIMLIRTGAQKADVRDNVSEQLSNNKVDSIHFVAYPNPFTTSLRLRYTLTKPALVNIMVSDLLTGKIVYRTSVVETAAGDHDDPVIFNGQPGNYIVTLRYGQKVKSAIVFKQ